MCFCDSPGSYPVYTSPLYTASAYAPSYASTHATVAGRVVPGSSRWTFANIFGRSHASPYFPTGTHFSARPMHQGHYAVPRPAAPMHGHHAHRSFRGTVRAPGLFG